MDLREQVWVYVHNLTAAITETEIKGEREFRTEEIMCVQASYISYLCVREYLRVFFFVAERSEMRRKRMGGGVRSLHEGRGLCKNG